METMEQEHSWNASNYSDSFTEEQWMPVVYSLVDALLFTVICGGNLLVIVAYHRSSRLKTVTNFFIVHLAYADLCVGATLPFHIATFLSKEFLKNFMVCLLRYVVIIVSVSQSVMTLLLMTIDRYVIIEKPFEHDHIMSPAKTRLAVTLTWLIAVVLGFVSPMLWNNGPTSYHANACHLTIILTKQYLWMVLFPSFLVCALIIIILYALLFKTAREKMRQSMMTNPNHQQFKSDMKTSKTVGMVLGFFVMCWLPFMVITGFETFGSTDLNQAMAIDHSRGFVNLMVVLNSGLNPFIYAFRMRDFKKEFKRMLRCPKKIGASSASMHASNSGPADRHTRPD